MAELQHLLGLLSPAGRAGGRLARWQAGRAAASCSRSPGLASSGPLTDRMRAAGLDVELRVRAAAGPAARPGPGRLPGHPGGAHQRAQARRVTARPMVTRGLPARRAASASPTRAAAPGRRAGASFRAPVAVPGTGRGLLGLRERVALYGGELTPARGRAAAGASGGSAADGSRPLAARSRAAAGRAGPARLRAGGDAGLQTSPAVMTVTAAPASPSNAEPPRVVIADDQNLVRSGFRMILRAAGIPVVAEAADGGEAVAAVLRHRPDVVLMDIRMPEMDGLEATRRILAAPAATAAGSSSSPPSTWTSTSTRRWPRAPAASCSSTSRPSTWSPPCALVPPGDALLAPSITRRLVERFAPRALRPPARARRPADLTPGTGGAAAARPRPEQRRTGRPS